MSPFSSDVSRLSRLFFLPLARLYHPRVTDTRFVISLRDDWLRQLAGGGDDGIRTHDPLLAGQVLSQLSYTPVLGFHGH